MQGSRASVFMDPDPAEVERAHALGSDRVELYAGPYSDAFANGHADSVLPAYVAAAKAARNLGIGLNTGHDLDLDNLCLVP